MKYCLLILISFSIFTINAQHQEVNLFEKSSHTKYVESQSNSFLKSNKLAGLSIQIANKGRLVYSKAFGFTDYTKRTVFSLNEVQPIMNATSLLTATAILKLLQEGKLSLEDTVFGPNSILEKDIPRAHKNVAGMTIRHLLDRNAYLHRGRYSESDKMLAIKTFIKDLQIKSPPGISIADNYFCYYVLGSVIEKVSGMSYLDYIKEMTQDSSKNEIILPEIQNIRRVVANNRPVQIIQDSTIGDTVNGLHCSAGDLMAFLLTIDGQGAVKDTLLPTALNILRTPNKIVKKRGRGWEYTKEAYYIHTHSDTGATMVHMGNNGVTWTLTTAGGPRGDEFYKKLETFVDKVLRRIRKLP